MFKKKNSFIYYLLTGVAIVLIWRGVWGLLDIYLLPNDLLFSYVLSFIFGMILLYLSDYSIEKMS